MDERTIEQIKEDNVTRLRRAKAWIEKAKSTKDDTSKFIFYWVAFNAQYSRDDNEVSEWCVRNEFFETIFSQDKDFSLADIINDNQDALKRIFELPQTYWCFWKKPKEKIENMEQWREHFKKEGSLPENNKEKLKMTFRRLSVVRNQIFHGGHSGNKDDCDDFSIQVEQGTKVLSNFIPCFFDIIQSSVDENSCTDLWGELSHHSQSKPGDVNCPPPWLLEGKK